jgi:hypothetical protein
MTYRENVDLAAVALANGEDANWELARLTFENTYDLGHIASQHDRVSMERWCADIRSVSARRFGTDSGRLYKAIWRKYGHYLDSDRPCWTDAYESVMAPRRQHSEIEGEPTEYETEMEYKSAVHPRLAPEAKRAIFTELAADPAVREEAAEIGSPVSRALSNLEHEAERIREQRHEQRIQTDPIERRLDQGQATADLMSICDRYARESERVAEQIAELLRRSGEPSEDRLFWIRQATERLRVVLALLERYAESGQTDLDSFLDSVLARRVHD